MFKKNKGVGFREDKRWKNVVIKNAGSGGYCLGSQLALQFTSYGASNLTSLNFILLSYQIG